MQQAQARCAAGSGTTHVSRPRTHSSLVVLAGWQEENHTNGSSHHKTCTVLVRGERRLWPAFPILRQVRRVGRQEVRRCAKRLLRRHREVTLQRFVPGGDLRHDRGGLCGVCDAGVRINAVQVIPRVPKNSLSEPAILVNRIVTARHFKNIAEIQIARISRTVSQR